jgi:HTH-type transcriptional regulator / antitoxin HigA
MEMNAQLAPVFDAWDAFQKTSGVRHIQNDKDYEETTSLADALLEEGAIQDTHPHHSLFLVLSDLIYAYDQRHYARAAVRGVDMLRFLMERHSLKQSDLPEIGAQSVVSDILSGKRELTVNHIRGLSKRFSVSPAAFF